MASINTVNPSGYTKLKTTAHNYKSFNNGIMGLGKEQNNYDLYKDTKGNYYLLTANGDYSKIDTSKLSDSIKNNLKNNIAISIPLSDIESALVSNLVNSVPGSSGGGHSGGGGRHDTDTNKLTNNNGGVGSGAPTINYNITNGGGLTAAEVKKLIEEVTKPNVMSADELAEIYGWDYNLDNIRANFDEKTRKYYDDLIAKQEQYRTDYVADNARYNRNIYNDYVDSYRNAAQTRSGRALRSANLLSSMINADQFNSENDYGMMQSVNNLREAQKAEYENNPYLAEQAYNTLGTYASQLSANLNASQVQQYVDKLTALANMYSAERQYQGYLAQGAAAKYSGLAGAAATNAANNSRSVYDMLYNYYYNQNQDLKSKDSSFYANRNVSDLITGATKYTS